MILSRYIIKELVFPFLLTLGVITAILMMDQTYKFIPFLQATGLRLDYLVRMVSYSLPTTLMLATPISIMVGVYYGVHRLSMDSEIIAMRSGGISLSFLFRPVLIVSAGVGFFMALLSFFVSPWGLIQMKALKYEILKEQTELNLSVGNINNFFGQKMILIQEKTPTEELKGILIADWKSPEKSVIIEAASGHIRFDEEAKKINFQLFKGRLHFPPQDGKRRASEYESLSYELNPPEEEPEANGLELGDAKRKIDMEMSLFELSEAMKTSPSPKLKREYKDEYHARFVTVISCFSFALFALPFGVFDPRNPKQAKFVYMLLLLVFYYSIYSQSRSMVVSGKAEVPLLYLPVFISLGIGLVNFFKINYDLSSIKEFFLSYMKRN